MKPIFGTMGFRSYGFLRNMTFHLKLLVKIRSVLVLGKTVLVLVSEKFRRICIGIVALVLQSLQPIGETSQFTVLRPQS